MIYLDNGATSFPKPRGVIDAMAHYCLEVGANPGRAGHRLSRAAAQVVWETRTAVADLLGKVTPERIVFTLNATMALNLALQGLLRPGDHVVATVMEHNSVLRPLRHLQDMGVGHTLVAADGAGMVDPDDVSRALQANTRLVAMVHASNVTGGVLPVAEVGRRCRQRGLLLLVDAAQSLGVLPVEPDVQAIDLVAGSGHKGLLGPMGTGFLYVRPGVEVKCPWPGGTGTDSESRRQPVTWPDGYESGTLNGPGIAGLRAGLAEVKTRGIEAIAAHEAKLRQLAVAGLQKLDGVILYGPEDAGGCVGTLSFNIDGMASSEVAHILDTAYDIAVRAGLHCAPGAHRAIGTFPHGTVRVSLGPLNTAADIEALVAAVAEIIAIKRR